MAKTINQRQWLTRLIFSGLLVLTLASCDSINPGPLTPFPSLTNTQPLASPTSASDTPTSPPVVITLPPATETPLPQPSATLPPTGPVFGLAWFHKPPTDAISYGDTTVKQMANEHRYMHLTGPSDIPFRRQLRAAGYKGPIYTYILGNSVEGPGPYKDASEDCEPDYTPHDNNMAWEIDDFCRYIHPNESWFLHNGKGERIFDDYFGNGRMTYLMDPANPGWQEFSYSRLQQVRDEWGYDGLWLDNLDLDLDRAATSDDNSDGRVREYATDAAWREGVKGWLAGLRARIGDWPLWANLVGGQSSADAWDPYAPYLDGAMEESFAVGWVDDRLAPEEWVSQVERAERWLAAGKGVLLVGQGPKDDENRLRFTLASYMLVARGDKSFFRYSRFDSFYHQLWLYPEYDMARALGAPTGPREEISPGVWRRNFDQGYVEVDLAEQTGRLALDSP